MLFESIFSIINIFLSNFFAAATCIAAGNFFYSKFNINNINFGIQITTGVLFVCILTLFLNFFSPINKIISYSIIIFFLFFYIYKKKNFKDLKKISILSFFSIFFYFLGNNAEDYSIYHLTHILSINQEKIVLGLVNLKMNLGQSSISFYGDALFQNLPFIKNPINYVSYIIFSALIFFLFDLIKIKKNYEVHDYLYFVASFFFILKFSRLGSHGGDFISPVLIIFGVYFFLQIKLSEIENQKNYSNIFNCLLFFSTAYFFKIFSIFYYFLIIIIFFLLLKKKCLKKFYNIIFFIFFVNLIFFIKNILISGCIIFPLSITCFDNLIWSMNKENIQQWKLVNEAWTKGWYSYFELNYNEYIKNFNWVKFWLKKQFIKSLEIIFIPILVIIILVKKIRSNLVYTEDKKINLTLIFIVSSVTSLFWLLNFPMVRLGYSSLLPFIILAINYKFLVNFRFKIKNKTKKIIIFIIPLFFIFKNTHRISQSTFDYEYSPYPRINKDSDEIIKKNKIKLKIENDVSYYMYEGIKCFNIKFPCIPTNKDKNFTFNKINNYLILKNKFK
jgi:hypothetical protein